MSDEPGSDLLIRASQAASGALGDPQRWLRLTEDLIDEARAGGDPEALVVALRGAAQAQRGVYVPRRALQLLTAAARVADRHGLQARLGEVLLARGVVRHELGQLSAARRDLDRAGPLIGPDAVGELALQRATLAQNTGRLAEAADRYREVIAGASEPLTLTRASNNLAVIAALRGRFAEAARWVDAATAAAAEVGPAYEAMTAETRAWVAVQSGRLAEGVELFATAEARFGEAGLPAGELYAEYADALLELRLLPEALEQARRAAATLDAQGVHLMAAEAALRVARLALLSGDAAEAGCLADEVAERLRRQRRPDWVARAVLVAVDARRCAGALRPADAAVAVRAARILLRSGMPSLAVEGFLLAGRVAEALGRRRTAVASWERASALSRRAPVLGRLKGHLAAALGARAGGEHATVLRSARRGLNDLARHRSALASTELRALASGHGAELGSLGLAVLVREGTPARVLAWMERTRAAALTAVRPVEAATPIEEMGELRALEGEIVEARRESGVEPVELRARQARVEARIRRAQWQARSGPVTAGGATVSRLAALRAALADRVLVEYDELDERLLAVVAAPGRTSLVDLGPTAAVTTELEGLRLALRVLPGVPASVQAGMLDIARTTVRRLRDLLVTPFGLPPGARTVVVPVGDLQRVPWSALHSGPVSVAPSAALWLHSSRVEPPAGGRVLLAAGPGLTGAVDEVAALREIHPSAVVLVPPDSRAERIRREVDGVALAHLACHGSIRADSPTFSSLLLADGRLTLQELESGTAAPYRLVLAACDVGGSTTYAGNEALGFVGTLLARGTGGLLASTLPVPDPHVSDLMVAVHKELATGLDLAGALHVARSRFGPTDAASYVGWCSFTAYGAA